MRRGTGLQLWGLAKTKHPANGRVGCDCDDMEHRNNKLLDTKRSFFYRLHIPKVLLLCLSTRPSRSPPAMFKRNFCHIAWEVQSSVDDIDPVFYIYWSSSFSP